MKVGAKDDFENRYMGRFRQLMAPHGVFVEYERDRAGRDIGVHLTQPNPKKTGHIMTPALIWFQMKGLMKSTLTKAKFDAASDVPISLKTEHLRFWYMNPQPTYLALYVESVDRFLVIDIQDWVRKKFGQAILTLKQKTVQVRVGKRNVLDDDFFRIIIQKNLTRVLKATLADESDADIGRFLRDMSKTRTEAYFENQDADGEWQRFREHWQYMMGDINVAFPYLTFSPERRAKISNWIDDEDSDGNPIWAGGITIVENEDDDALVYDDEPLDGECLLSFGENDYSYGEMFGGEQIVHHIGIGLNDIGDRWAARIDVLEAAEVLSVVREPHSISVAPWHARDI